MKESLNSSQFCHRFKQIRPENFSWAALGAIFEYLEECEEDVGEELEFDPIAICCDYSEHTSALDCINDAGYDAGIDDLEEDEKEGAAMEYLRDNTQVIEFDGGIVIQGF